VQFIVLLPAARGDVVAVASGRTASAEFNVVGQANRAAFVVDEVFAYERVQSCGAELPRLAGAGRGYRGCFARPDHVRSLALNKNLLCLA